MPEFNISLLPGQYLITCHRASTGSTLLGFTCCMSMRRAEQYVHLTVLILIIVLESNDHCNLCLTSAVFKGHLFFKIETKSKLNLPVLRSDLMAFYLL